MKYIHKDGSVTYTLRVYIGTTLDGKKQTATKSWKPEREYTEMQLEKELTRQQVLFEEEVKRTFAKNGRYTFEAFSKKWINEVSIANHKASTTKSYENMLARVCPVIGHIRLDKLTPDVLNQFMLSLQKNDSRLDGQGALSSKTARNYFTMLSSILNTAKKWGIISENPMQQLTPPKVRRKKVDALEKDEVAKIFNLLEKEPLKYNLYIKMAVLSGLRRGEMLGLKWEDIDFERRLITVNKTVQYVPGKGTFVDTTKTESSNRTIKLSNMVFDLLRAHHQEQEREKNALGNLWEEHGFVFTQWNGAPMYPESPYKFFTSFLKRNGLEHHTIHSLRHTTATLLIMDGAPVKAVSARLGHSDTGTTQNIYTSYLQTADEMVTDALDDILNLDTKNKD